MKYTPHPYQEHAKQHILDNEASGLFLEMGLGKTVTTMTAIDHLLHDSFEVGKVLVIAPKKVAEDTWTSEASKWDHLRHLRISKVLGSERQRKEALKVKADIYVINRENVVWLIGYYATHFPFDMVVIDELSSFKAAGSQRFKALRKVMPLVRRRVGLTGTPMPNSLLDLWSQMYLLDAGERLGKTVTSYRDKYFIPGKRNGHVVYNYNLRQGDKGHEDTYQREIYDKIGDICISMKAEDYLSLPERIDVITPVHLPAAIKTKYDEFEKSQVLALDTGDISAVNAAVLSGKLLQFAGGAVYREDKTFYEVHDEKLQVLAEKVEAANGQPVLIAYWYQHERDRILKALRAFKPEVMGKDTSECLRRWNAGKIPVLLIHPASAGHGLNMQTGGHRIIWYSNIWSLELYQQTIARIDRQGQQMPVICDRLVVVGTMDEDAVKAKDTKAEGQNALMHAVKARINRYRHAVTN